MKLFSYFSLANTRNPLKQGISSNLKPLNKSNKKREFTPKQETKAKTKQRSIGEVDNQDTSDNQRITR